MNQPHVQGKTLVTSHYLWRGICVWLGIAVVETLHGALRVQLLVPVLGDLASRQIGIGIGSGLIFAIAWLSTRWMDARGYAQELTLGVVWGLLMLGFEITLGRILGLFWARIAADYDPTQGGYMTFAMLFLLLAPWLAARGRGRNTPSSSTYAHSRD